MTDTPLNDATARQYARWVYPQPVDDLSVRSRTFRDFCDPALAHRVFWPDRDYPAKLDILVAGCGANQAADIAYHNRGARVLGIDVSEPSLAHERHLKAKHGLDNLELLRLPIEDVSLLGRDFDLILSTGVLHHMADPGAGLAALSRCLRRDGVLALYLYGRHGRAGLEIVQSLFRQLGLVQDEPSLALARHTLDSLPPEHPLQAAKNILADLHFDAGVVDMFLNARERSYAVEDCLKFVADAGLVFQGWLENGNYYPEACLPYDSPLQAALLRLPVPDLWGATDLFKCNPGHFFLACRRDRPAEQYQIDFDGERALQYVPFRRAGVQVLQPDRATGAPARLTRFGLETSLNDLHVRLLNEVDERRTLTQIFAAASAAGMPGTAQEIERFGRAYFRSLWRMGLITVRLMPGATVPGVAAGSVSESAGQARTA